MHNPEYNYTYADLSKKLRTTGIPDVENIVVLNQPANYALLPWQQDTSAYGEILLPEQRNLKKREGVYIYIYKTHIGTGKNQPILNSVLASSNRGRRF